MRTTHTAVHPVVEVPWAEIIRKFGSFSFSADLLPTMLVQLSRLTVASCFMLPRLEMLPVRPARGWSGSVG